MENSVKIETPNGAVEVAPDLKKLHEAAQKEVEIAPYEGFMDIVDKISGQPLPPTMES